MSDQPEVKLPPGVHLIQATSSHLWSESDLTTFAPENVARRDGTGRTLLAFAARHGAEDFARQLVSAGADVNAADLLGGTPLHYASQSGCLSIVRALLEAGADVEARGLDGWSALGFAVIREHEPVVEMLIDRGAPIDVEIRGCCLVRMAVQVNNTAILGRLLVAGANTDRRGFDGRTPIELARHLGRTECLRLLEPQD